MLPGVKACLLKEINNYVKMKKSVLTTSVVSKVMFELGSLGIQIADSVLHFNPFLKAANKDESQIVEFISGFLSFFSFFKGFCRFTLRNIFPNMSCPGHRKRSKKKKNLASCPGRLRCSISLCCVSHRQHKCFLYCRFAVLLSSPF